MTTYGIKDLTKLYSVGEHTILAWISNGELEAINVARKQGGRPKWRIKQSALDAFEALRAAANKPPPRASRLKSSGDVIEFY